MIRSKPEYMARVIVWFAGSTFFMAMALAKSTFTSFCILITLILALNIVLFKIPDKRSGKK